MKKFYSLMAAAALTGGLATAAIAAEHESQSTSPAGTTSQPGTATMGAEGSHSMGTTGSSAMHKDFEGEHTMSGTISKINQSEGTLSLKTEKETLDLHFPPAALTNFKEGDQVEVHLGIAKKDGTTSGTMGSETSGSSMQ